MSGADCPDDQPAVALSDLCFAWGGGGFSLAVDRLEIARGERVMLLGPSGSGKSTLLSLLSGIVVPEAGTVRVLGTDLAGLSGPARDRFRAEHLGIVFQMFNLLPYASPLDNVLLALAFAPGRRARLGRGARDEALRLLSALGLPTSRMETGAAARLSIGQQQRVAVARALIGGPEILIADEPTSALDPEAQGAFLALLFKQARAAGATLVLVTHDDRLAPRFDRVLRLPEIARTAERAPA